MEMDGCRRVVGGERGLCCMAKLLMTAHPPIIPLLLPWERKRDRAREGRGMREIIDKVIQVRG